LLMCKGFDWMDEQLIQNYNTNLKIIQEQRKSLLGFIGCTDSSKLVLEKTADENYTCRVKTPSGTETYLYSRYRPLETARKSLGKFLAPEGKNFLVLGLGLGYELVELYRQVKDKFEQIIVIENKPEFFNLFLYVDDYTEILSDSRVVFLIHSVTDFKISADSFIIIENPNLTALAPGYYKNVITEISFALKRTTANRIIVFEHVTFADDVISAFEQLGFQVEKMKLVPDLDATAAKIKEVAPLFLFSINFNSHILRIANHLKLPYISWTVDTPSPSLFNHQNKSSWAILFVYENEVVKRLQRDGFTNVFYLPAAANIARFEETSLTQEDYDKYSCAVSFIGTAGHDNEYQKFYRGHIDSKLESLIEKINVEQLNNPSSYMVPELIKRYNSQYNIDITQLVYEQSQIRLDADSYTDDDERFSYVLAKEICGCWRRQVIAQLAAHNDVYVYGDRGWEQFSPMPSRLKYKGFAEHFKEVPRIYKASKINLNLTRLYVESGLPMRVFDTLAAGGFLLTNQKSDLDVLFKPGKDLVVFNNKAEMLEAVEYYLNKKEEREAIASRGFETVQRKHTFIHRMQEVVNLVWQKFYLKSLK